MASSNKGYTGYREVLGGIGGPNQALTGTRYPTLPGFYFYYPYPTRNFFQNFRVQGSNSTCCFLSRIIDYINDASQSTPEEERKFTKDCEY